MPCDLTPDNHCIYPYDLELEPLGEDQIYPQGGPELDPVMKADQHPILTDISGDSHMDLAIGRDTVDGKLAVIPGVFPALCETGPEARLLRMCKSLPFHSGSPYH